MKIKEITFQAKPKKEAAGVGIVTKQNATKDVPVGGEYMNVKKLGLGKGKPKKIKDSVIREGEARIQHAEDLVLFDGSRGAKRALGELKQIPSGGENVTIKWDGSPAVIFGRDVYGDFILTDKSGFSAVKTDGRAKSPEQLKDILLNRGGGKNKDDPGRIAFANNMAGIFDIFKVVLCRVIHV